MESTASATAPVGAHKTLSQEELDLARAFLQQTQDHVIGVLKGVSPAQAEFRPSPEAWSIAQNLEHILFVQERVLAVIRERLTEGPPPPADRNTALIDAIVIHQFPTRLKRFSGPDVVMPKAGIPVAEAIDRVVGNTRRYADCLESIPNLRGDLLDSPPLKAMTNGEHTLIDGYQLILAAAAHTQRHVKQILEVKANTNYPES